MTRKDYQLIADALREARNHALRENAPDGGAWWLAAAAGEIAAKLAQDNPRFDRGRFLKAAGVQS